MSNDNNNTIKPTHELIESGKNSSDPRVRKMAKNVEKYRKEARERPSKQFNGHFEESTTEYTKKIGLLRNREAFSIENPITYLIIGGVIVGGVVGISALCMSVVAPDVLNQFLNSLKDNLPHMPYNFQLDNFSRESLSLFITESFENGDVKLLDTLYDFNGLNAKSYEILTPEEPLIAVIVDLENEV